MNLTMRACGAVLAALSVFVHSGVSHALLSDQREGRWKLIGKARLEATFRTTETPENNPIPIEAGDLISQRNLLFLEWKHDLGDVLPRLNLGYYLEGRFYYDGAWDYGPDVLSDDATRRTYGFINRGQINDLKWDADLFMGYLDITSGPLFCRIGRQICSWGEMSTLRVLDGTNPTDNSTLAVDLLERLVPLFMVRSNVTLDNVGPFSSVSLQGYYIPGELENRNGEDIIDGSPIYPPIGRYKEGDLFSTLTTLARQVPDDITSDRYGAKLGVMWGGLNLNFAYYRRYSETPVPLLNLASFSPVYVNVPRPYLVNLVKLLREDPLGTLLGHQKFDVILKLRPVDVFGGSFNYHWELIDTVVRGEVAYYRNVPKMTPGSINDVAGGLAGKIHINGHSLGPLVSGIDLDPLLGGTALPFTTGEIVTFDTWNWGVGLDKFMKIPHLSRQDFTLIAEYIGRKTLGYRENYILQPWQGPHGETLYEPEYSNTFVFIAQTNYLNGNLTPQLVVLYEVEPKALSLIPSIHYEWRQWAFDVNYQFTTSASYAGTLGMLETRDQVQMSLTYNF